MKRLAIIGLIACTLQACGGGNGGEGGVTNDGMQAVDTDGALVDTTGAVHNPSIDSSIGEGRVDVQPRAGSAATPK